MNYELITNTIDRGDGRPITIETGKLAKQAHGSVVVRQGDTMLLATVVAAEEAKEGIDFYPLRLNTVKNTLPLGVSPVDISNVKPALMTTKSSYLV
jgi:polyribonucleotide nucleotidyltransferase